MKSIRTALIATVTTVASILFGLLGLTFFLVMRNYLYSQFDTTIQNKMHLLMHLTQIHRDGLRIQGVPNKSPEFLNAYRPEYFVIWTADGKEISRSDSFGTQPVAMPNLPLGQMSTYDITLPDGRPGRLLTAQFIPHRSRTALNEGPTEAIVLAYWVGTDTLLETLSMIREAVIISIICIIVVSDLVLWFFIHRCTRPLSKIAARIDAIRPRDLPVKLDIKNVPAELQPIIVKLNEAFAKLHESFEREKAFSSDVAHELRTPLSGLIFTLDMALARKRDTRSYQETIAKALAIAGSMRNMTENLMLVARAEAGQLVIHRESFDLRAFIQDRWLPHSGRAIEKELIIRWDSPESLAIYSDREKLGMVMSNLIQNAVAYTNNGGRIDFKIVPSSDHVIVEVSNSVDNIDTAIAERAFDRFWRGDSGRAGSNLHFGLGLSLCKKLMALLGGEIFLQVNDGQRFTAAVRLPGSSFQSSALPSKGGVRDDGLESLATPPKIEPMLLRIHDQ